MSLFPTSDATSSSSEATPLAADTPSTTRVWRSRPLVAALLNLCPGLGHIYSGQVVLGVAVSLLILAWTLGLLYVSCYLEMRAQRLAAVAIAFGSHWIGVPILGYLAAKRATPMTKRWYQRWYSLLLFCLAYWSLGPPFIVRAVVPSVMAVYRVAGVSMWPTLLPDDLVVARSDTTGVLRRGDVVVFALGDGQLRIQRVVGVPGDTVVLRNFHAIVNGEPEARRLGPCRHADIPADWSERTRLMANWGPAVVPDGQYALFGDCRDNAVDVRYVGFAPRQNIVKRVAWIYWSSDEHGVRFDRIGQAAP